MLVPGKAGLAALDNEGLQALSLLRQLGMPAVIGVASGACPDQAANAAAKMKEKAAARKRATAVLASEVRLSPKHSHIQSALRRCTNIASCTLFLSNLRLRPAFFEASSITQAPYIISVEINDRTPC